MRIRRRHPLPSKEISKIRGELCGYLTGPQLDSLIGDPVEQGSAGGMNIVLSNGEPVLFYPDASPFPTLKGFLRIGVPRPSITVDMGAVPYVTNGADIMAPGVVEMDEGLEPGDLCVVVEERHGKPLCVARMLMSSRDCQGIKKGKVAENIHHVGDQLWKTEVL